MKTFSTYRILELCNFITNFVQNHFIFYFVVCFKHSPGLQIFLFYVKKYSKQSQNIHHINTTYNCIALFHIPFNFLFSGLGRPRLFTERHCMVMIIFVTLAIQSYYRLFWDEERQRDCRQYSRHAIMDLYDLMM